MAFTKLDNNATITHRQYFLIDSEDDLEILEQEVDCEHGDKAELPNGTIYSRHSDGFDGDLWEVIEKNETGKINKGYKYQKTVFVPETKITITDDNVNNPFFSDVDFSKLEENDECIITWNKVEYKLKVQKDGATFYLGEVQPYHGPVYTTYPFCITFAPTNHDGIYINLEESNIPSTITIKIEKITGLIVEKDFEDAVKKVIEDENSGSSGGNEQLMVTFTVNMGEPGDSPVFSADKTYQEIATFLEANGPMNILGRISDTSGGYYYLSLLSDNTQSQVPELQRFMFNMTGATSYGIMYFAIQVSSSGVIGETGLISNQ